MRVKLPVAGEAERWGHDLARQIETAFDRAQEAPNAGPFTYKKAMVDRMTDAELAIFETKLDDTTPRMRQTWYAIQAVYHKSNEYPMFYGVFVDTFGRARADQIFRVSGNA